MFPNPYEVGLTPWLDENTVPATFQAIQGSEISLYLDFYGDGPVEITLTDITFSDIVLEGALLVFGGLGGALIIGVILGYIFGKMRGKK